MAVCPLTGEDLPSDPLECATLFAVPIPSLMPTCGHSCTLGALMNEVDKHKKCPVCNQAQLLTICDGTAAEYLRHLQQPIDDEDAGSEQEMPDLVCFRYGVHIYYLTLPKGTLAQDRIGSVLLIDQPRILCRGKMVGGTKTKNEDAGDDQQTSISQTILQHSASEIMSKKKPSMVVMGKRTGRRGSHAGRLRK